MRECARLGNFRWRSAGVGKEEPFLHRTGAMRGDSKNNSNEAPHPFEKSSCAKKALCRQRAITTVFSMEWWIVGNPWIILRTDRRGWRNEHCNEEHGCGRAMALW